MELWRRQMSWFSISSPVAKTDQARPALVWAWQTACTSGRALWISECIKKPAAFAGFDYYRFSEITETNAIDDGPCSLQQPFQYWHQDRLNRQLSWDQNVFQEDSSKWSSQIRDPEQIYGRIDLPWNLSGRSLGTPPQYGLKCAFDVLQRTQIREFLFNRIS